MQEEVAEDILGRLRTIQKELDMARERDHEILQRLSRLQLAMARCSRENADNYAEIIHDRHRADRMKERLDEIERLLKERELPPLPEDYI